MSANWIFDMRSVFPHFNALFISRVNDEKESRQYLEDLTRLLKDEVDHMKQTCMLTGNGSIRGDSSKRGSDVTWQQRRNNKVDKKELLALTSSLDQEIKAKESVVRELNEAREKVWL